jgi:protein-S-isoprenylcysteine O-methyltransferase Ste14
MNSKVIIIIAFSYLYLFFELFMNFKQNKYNTIIKSDDKGSLWLLYILITIGYILSFSIGSTKIGRIYKWDKFFIIGIIIIVIGLFIRIKAILTLNKYFTYTVSKIDNHKLIDTGLYKIIRHPGYLGQIIIFMGISCALSNWLSIILMSIPVAIGYLYRIKVEEFFMKEQIGEDYVNYQKRSKKLIPLIY